MPYIHNSDADAAALRQAYEERPLNVLEVNDKEAQRIVNTVTAFYQEQLDDGGTDGYIIGLSGGIDSSAVAYLITEAVGPENVYGVILPAEHTREEDVELAQHVASELGIATNELSRFREQIDAIVDQLERLGKPVDAKNKQRVKRGNILARCRMIVLRDIAKARNELVAGTTNASERDLGYMTLAADGKGGVDNEALYDIYKTTERQVAAQLGVPQEVIEKAPTADLWQGQTDQDELRYPYKVLDQILAGLRLDFSAEAVAECVDRVTASDVEAIQKRVERNWFKRGLAPHPSF